MMCKKVCYIFLCIFCSVSCCNHGDMEHGEYISEESSEKPEINEVVSSDTQEYLDKSEEEILQDTGYLNNSSKLVTPSTILMENNITSTYDTTKTSTDQTSTDQSSTDQTSTTIAGRCPMVQDTDNKEDSLCEKEAVSYPYTVSIQKRGAHYATGALYSKQLVLTAASDFYHVRESIKLYKVRLGSLMCKKKGIVLPIQSLSIHPSFKLGNPAFDLAVIRLASAVNITEFIKPIALSTVPHKVLSAKFLTTYWPRLVVKGKVLPSTAKERAKPYSLRVSIQKMIPWDSCESIMKVRGADLDKNSLCLKPISPHHSLCLPDAGAPVVADDTLWGITSGWTSKHCHLYPSPTILTRVSLKPISTWLDEVS